MADDEMLMNINASSYGNVSVHAPHQDDARDLVEFLRSNGADVDAVNVHWAGPYEALLAVMGGGGVGTYITMWLQSRPNYTLTIQAEDGSTITCTSKKPPTQDQVAKIDDLFASRRNPPSDPSNTYEGPASSPV